MGYDTIGLLQGFVGQLTTNIVALQRAVAPPQHAGHRVSLQPRSPLAARRGRRRDPPNLGMECFLEGSTTNPSMIQLEYHLVITNIAMVFIHYK